MWCFFFHSVPIAMLTVDFNLTDFQVRPARVVRFRAGGRVDHRTLVVDRDVTGFVSTVIQCQDVGWCKEFVTLQDICQITKIKLKK